jgi:hypothetical protein
VSWGEPSFRKLIDAVPETLTVAHADHERHDAQRDRARRRRVREYALAGIRQSRAADERQRQLALRAIGIYRTLRESGIVEKTPEGDIRLTVDLQPNFALNQPLSPFALAAFELLDPDPAAGTGTARTRST